MPVAIEDLDPLVLPPLCWPARWALGDFPTPVESCVGLSRLTGKPVWVKRDDRSSTLYGGSKVRKLEFVLAAPALQRAGCVVSIGTAGSHHLLALALFLEHCGLPRLCALFAPQAMSAAAWRNLAVLASVAQSVRAVPARALLPAAVCLHGWAHGFCRGGAARVAAGASSPLGAVGFVRAALELGAQVRAGACPAPGTIYVAGGTGGCAAGLWLGLALAGLRCRLCVVAVVERPLIDRGRLARLRRRVADLLKAPGDEAQGVELVLDRAQLGRGYADATDQARRAVERARADGLELETTYTGKVLAAVLARTAEDPGPALLWNTHGGPAPLGHLRTDWQGRLPRTWRLSAPERVDG